MVKTGDIVRYLNAVGGGRVIRIDGNMAYVDEDGFETPVLVKECVVVTPAQPSKDTGAKYVAPPTAPRQPEAPKEQIAETDEEESKHLNTTEYDAYLVNDSNYFLYFTYLTRADGHDWVTRYADIVEPNMQVHVQHLTREDIPDIDRVAVQYIAFKRDKEFKLKAPVAVEYAVDNTKFFKLHCFRENVYFDVPVIAFNIVKNDIPQRPMVIDSSRLEDAMKIKKMADKPERRPVERHKERPNVIEVDLHIDQLLDNKSGLSNTDMLNVQLKEFNRVMEENLRHKGQKIVFIHGKGEGVLRNALLKELRLKYKHCDVQDASFREYGFGATQVTIR